MSFKTKQDAFAAMQAALATIQKFNAPLPPVAMALVSNCVQIVEANAKKIDTDILPSKKIYIEVDFIPKQLRIFTAQKTTVAQVSTNESSENYIIASSLQTGEYTLAIFIDDPIKNPKCKRKSLDFQYSTNEGQIIVVLTVKVATNTNSTPKINKENEHDSEALFIVFPDYKIDVGVAMMEGLGHAGVLLISSTGQTEYFEYGRYDENGIGLVRKKTIPDVAIGKDGKATKEALKKALKSISTQSGKSGRIEAIYFEKVNFQKMNNYALKKLSDNKNTKRQPYSINANNCGTFAQDVISQDNGANTLTKDEMPFLMSPVNMLDKLNVENTKVDYNPSDNNLIIEGDN